MRRSHFVSSLLIDSLLQQGLNEIGQRAILQNSDPFGLAQELRI
jgi:hypothetical protein